MAFKIKTIILKENPEATYVQNYTDELNLASEWEYKDSWIAYMRYNVATDGDGYVYFKDGNYIKKYTQIGMHLLSKWCPTLYAIAPIEIGSDRFPETSFVGAYIDIPKDKYYRYHGWRRGCKIQPNPEDFEKYATKGDTYIYYLNKSGGTYYVNVLHAYDLSIAGGHCMLTPGKVYYGLVMTNEIVDDFYTYNATDNKIEKWNRTGGKIKEKSVGPFHDVWSIGLAGDLIMGGGGQQYYWITDKNLEGTIKKCKIKNGGEEYEYGASICISSIDEEYFLMVFKAANTGEQVKRYIRKYDNEGNIVNTKMIDTGEKNAVVCTK